jgi:GT2 family glycosyltransferase
VPTLAIIVVSYNVRDDLAACLDSVVGHTAPYVTEIIVVDNGSSDGTVETVRERWPAVRVLESGANLGFARANNAGIRASASEYVLLLNPDTIVPPGAIPALVRALASHPEAAIAGPRLVDDRGFPELSFGPMPSPWGEAWQKTVLALYERRVTWVVRQIERWTRVGGPRQWVSGACLLARRADLEHVGLFDERFFLYMEDVDLCAAVRRMGRRVLFVPQAEVIHRRGRAGTAAPGATRRYRRQSHRAFYEKHYPLFAPLLRLWIRARDPRS